MTLPLLWLLVMAPWSAVVPQAPDTLVVCPAELRAALAPWEAYRRGQGHVLQVVDAPATVEGVQAAIAQAYRKGGLQYVVLVGDVAADRAAQYGHMPPVVPTHFVPARVNVRWGSEPTIATDGPYADVDGDRMPDLAVGRIPADSPAELAAFVRKIIRYEQQADGGPGQRQINVVAGAGGFGPVADALVQGAARSVLQQAVPNGYTVRATMINEMSAPGQVRGDVRARVQRELSDGCLAWVYMGHGLPTELDRVHTPAGDESILTVEDVANVRCPAAAPLAVLVACYTGALDAPRDCLAEQLALAEHGPVAVIAATRVTMPYGNTVLGYELLRANFAADDAVLGAIWQQAQCGALAEAADDPVRSSLDALARGVSPPPVDLAGERQEHVSMYQLLGDPLLRFQRPTQLELDTPSDVTAGQLITVAGRSSISGSCTVELLQVAGHAEDELAVATDTQPIQAGQFEVALHVPAHVSGRCTVRAFVRGAQAAAVGASDVTVRRPTGRISRNPGRPALK